MGDRIRIAIDGPSGAGKSTVARRVAEALDIDYIDTGAMYRAVGFKMLAGGIGPEDREALGRMLEDTEIDIVRGSVLLDGEIIDDKIRTPEVSRMASAASALPEVRGKLVALQRTMGESKSVVMDGRDIGTNVLRDAEYKFYLTASVEERARRRWMELLEKGDAPELEQVEQDMVQRDLNDSTRELNPLRKAEEAIEIDSSNMDADQVVKTILESIE